MNEFFFYQAAPNERPATATRQTLLFDCIANTVCKPFFLMGHRIIQNILKQFGLKKNLNKRKGKLFQINFHMINKKKKKSENFKNKIFLLLSLLPLFA